MQCHMQCHINVLPRGTGGPGRLMAGRPHHHVVQPRFRPCCNAGSTAKIIDTMAPTLYYWPLRGRLEVVRLILAHNNVDFVEEAPADMKTDKAGYPFGQAPRYKDETVDMCQSNSIIRYLGRKHSMDGVGEPEKVLVDQAMEAVESLRVKYLALVYQEQLSDSAKQVFYDTHISRASADGRNGGAHLSYLEWCITRTPEGVASSGLTVGDVAVFDLTDTLLRILDDKISAEYPKLKAFHTKISALPGIQAYLASDKRSAKVNGNSLG